jgi:predicted ATP-dependent serine protease
MSKKRIKYYTPDEIKQKRFNTIPLNGYFGDLLGQPERGFWLLIYARPKQGKSYLTTMLANALTEHLGPGAYWSCEEGVGYSVKRRLDTLGIDGRKLRFVTSSDKEDADRIIGSPANRFTVIDSPEHLGLSLSEAKDLFERYHKRKTVLLVQHVNSNGTAKGGIGWDHLVDIILQIERPYVHQAGRYGGASKLLLPGETSAAAKPTLFNQEPTTNGYAKQEH